jgi:hypothetical protein
MRALVLGQHLSKDLIQLKEMVSYVSVSLSCLEVPKSHKDVLT